MGLYRDDETGKWSLTNSTEDKRSHPSYLEALPKYLNCYEPVFSAAKSKSEFDFICTILSIGPSSDAGWDPFETTTTSIPKILEIIEHNQSSIASEHLLLWTYGHIIEASEPYELLYNMAIVAGGGRHNISNYPDIERKKGVNRPQTVGEKIQNLSSVADKKGFSEIVIPIKDAYDRDLRNSIFHADYSFFGSELRTRNPARQYSHEEKLTFVNKALAYLEALRIMREYHISYYKEPKEILCGEGFSNIPNERATIIVREGHGAIGLKHSWTRRQVKKGAMPWHIARFHTREESQLFRKNPELAVLPAIIPDCVE